MAASFHNVFVGSERGYLKGINVEKNTWDNLTDSESAAKQNEIDVMCWGNAGQTEVAFGLRNRSIQVYNTEDSSFTDVIDFSEGEGKYCGLAKHNSCFVTATTSGVVNVWQKNEKVTLNASKNLCCMQQNASAPHQISTGGDENELKLWDLTSPDKPIFTAKNVRPDWLNLRVPVWVSGIQFLPGTEKIVTCTGHHQVRVYDPKAQRRPVCDMTFDEYPITAISVYGTSNQVVIGNTQGSMALLDLRNKGKIVQRYKGFAGCIKCLQCHPDLPLVASCGLDRFLRIHDINSKQLVHKFYLKSRLNCLLFGKKWSEGEDHGTEEERTGRSMEHDSGHCSDDEDLDDDEVWGQMDTVQTHPAKENDCKTNKKQKRKLDTISSKQEMTKKIKKKITKI